MDPQNSEVNISVDGRVSKLDKWDYNTTLNLLARNVLFSKKTPMFGYWVDRFITALKVVDLKNLPIKQLINDKDLKYRDIYYYDKAAELKKNNEIWCDPYKRDYWLSIWEEDYWENLFNYALEIATQAGFTINIDAIDESVSLRV